MIRLLGLLWLSFVALSFADIGISAELEGAEQEVIKAHAIALYGEPKYPADFQHLDYVNPDAPKGGSIRLNGSGTFDTLNPYTLKGISPFNSPGFFLYGVSELNEPLMVGTGQYFVSGDEPQTAYGLIAESIEYPEDRSWAIFNLRTEARFHDGHPITAEDVLFSYNTLIKDGHPRFAYKYEQVDRVEVLDSHRIKFYFKPGDTRNLPILVSELPVLPKHFWEGREFGETLLEPPLGSGPYRVVDFEAGRHISFERVQDYWGQDLAINRGRYNFDQVRVDYYRDLNVAFEAFKSGDYDFHREYTASRWAMAYDFPAVKNGEVIKVKIPHSVPVGLQAFFLNTRRPLFADARVRQAIGLMFDFEWFNKHIFHGAYVRNTSLFPNTEFSATGIPVGEELKLLEPYREQLPAALFDQAFEFPKTTGQGTIRSLQRKALRLLKSAGWQYKQGKLFNAEGDVFRFEIINDQPTFAKVLLPFKKNLERLGIEVTIRNVDRTQFKNRVDRFDFDVIVDVLPQSLSMSYELEEYFHSSRRDATGARNYSGIAHPVADALIAGAIAAPSREALINHLRALDRVLLWQHYVIPQYHLNYHRIAYWNKFGRPSVTPPYDLSFSSWWYKD